MVIFDSNLLFKLNTFDVQIYKAIKTVNLKIHMMITR